MANRGVQSAGWRMGLPTWVRDWLKQRYGGAFSFHYLADQQPPSVCIYDLMQDLKVLPDYATTLKHVIDHYTNRIKTLFYSPAAPLSSIRVVVVCVDRMPPAVKKMVAHAKHYKDKMRLSPKDAPHLPLRESDPVLRNRGDEPKSIPELWSAFASKRRNFQRELFPRLFNALMNLPLKPGQKLILHGFPGYSEWVPVYKQQAHTLGTNETGHMLQVHSWTPDELPLTAVREAQDADLYNRIFFMEHVVPCEAFPGGAVIRGEWEEARNTINEADGAMFYYDHWFQHESIMFSCNDGDVIPYGLLYAYERVTMGNAFRNLHVARLPYKKTKGSEAFPQGKIPQFEYVDLNALYRLVMDDSLMKASGVQNHAVTLVFMIIMAGSDFFDNYMKGIGAEKGIWEPFLSSLVSNAHLVQSSKGVAPNTRPPNGRTIEMDEERFRFFVTSCYMEKYGKAARKRLKRDELTFEDIRVQCNSGAKAAKDEEYRMPDRNKVRLWGRQVLWNLIYYRNAPFDKQPDPFERGESDGLPYYGYHVNPETNKSELSPVVSVHEKPRDEVYQQHMLAHK